MEGQMFIPRDQQIYADKMSRTRPHKEEVLKLSSRKLTLIELQIARKSLLSKISNSEKILDEMDYIDNNINKCIYVNTLLNSS